MTREEWLNSINKEELAFRLYGKDYFQRTCLDCVFYKKDEFGHWKCNSEEHEADCERQFTEWLDEDMDD